MTQLAMNHPASWCFGTSLASDSVGQQVGSGMSHTEQRLCGNRDHDSDQRVVWLASVEELSCRLFQYRSCFSTRVAPGKRAWNSFNVSSPSSLVVIRTLTDPFLNGSSRFTVSTPTYNASPSRMTIGGNEGWNHTSMDSDGMIIPPRGSVTTFISQGQTEINRNPRFFGPYIAQQEERNESHESSQKLYNLPQ